VSCVRNSLGNSPCHLGPNPMCLTRTNQFRHHRLGDLRRTVLKEKPIELREASTHPPNAGERGVGRMQRTRRATVEGPVRPSHALL
jgi:hypothetical protein